MHLVGFIIRIYHDAWSPECQIPTFIVAYLISVCFQEILVSAPWRWRGNRAETCRSYVKDCTYKLKKSALDDVTWVFTAFVIYLKTQALAQRLHKVQRRDKRRFAKDCERNKPDLMKYYTGICFVGLRKTTNYIGITRNSVGILSGNFRAYKSKALPARHLLVVTPYCSGCETDRLRCHLLRTGQIQSDQPANSTQQTPLLISNSTHFTEYERSLPCLQKPVCFP